jgi:hypothetical protein
VYYPHITLQLTAGTRAVKEIHLQVVHKSSAATLILKGINAASIGTVRLSVMEDV